MAVGSGAVIGSTSITRVAVGGTGVAGSTIAVGVLVGVFVGVSVGIAVGGTGVLVGGTGVLVGVSSGSRVRGGTAVLVGVLVGVLV